MQKNKSCRSGRSSWIDVGLERVRLPSTISPSRLIWQSCCDGNLFQISTAVLRLIDAVNMEMVITKASESGSEAFGSFSTWRARNGWHASFAGLTHGVLNRGVMLRHPSQPASRRLPDNLDGCCGNQCNRRAPRRLRSGAVCRQ